MNGSHGPVDNFPNWAVIFQLVNVTAFLTVFCVFWCIESGIKPLPIAPSTGRSTALAKVEVVRLQEIPLSCPRAFSEADSSTSVIGHRDNSGQQCAWTNGNWLGGCWKSFSWFRNDLQRSPNDDRFSELPDRSAALVLWPMDAWRPVHHIWLFACAV